jgi:low molecular weight protein-tyrosine phosphatase
LSKKEGKSMQFEIDSAGTSGYHVGQRADRRMQQHAIKRGYNLTSISRQFDPQEDFDNFDLIVAMDDTNFYDLKEMARLPEDEEKIVRMTDFSANFDYDHIPDPYFGGSSGFEIVLDLLEDASKGLLEKYSH